MVECEVSGGGVLSSGGIKLQCTVSCGGVLVSCGIIGKRIDARSGIFRPRCIVI